MRNIEIKARLHDPQAAETTAASLAGPHPIDDLRQVDTYFNLAEGRLKLREFGEAKAAELIFYRRGDFADPKPCDYSIAPIVDPAPIKALLTQTLGVKATVAKERRVYLYERARIHLDRVEALGSFIEFEAITAPGFTDAEGEQLVKRLMAIFSIPQDDIIAESYCDLAIAEGKTLPE